MNNPDLKLIKLEDLELNDTTKETRWMHNNTDNFECYRDMTSTPSNIIEKLALGALFTSKDEFQSDPTDIGPMGNKLLHHCLMQHCQSIEAMLKTLSRHGEKAVTEGDAAIQKIDKKTGEVSETMHLTALENLLQAATLGTYIETVYNISMRGDEEKMRILNKLLQHTEDNKDTVLETPQEMRKFLAGGETVAELLKDLVKGYGDDISLQEVFTSPRELAEVLSNHKDGTEDFMIAYKRNLHTRLHEMPSVDRNILADKAERLTADMCAKLKTTDFPSK